MTFHVNTQNGFSIESSIAMNTLEFLDFFILFHIGWISVRIFRILKQLIFQIIIFKYQRIVKEDNTGYGGSFHSKFHPVFTFHYLFRKIKISRYYTSWRNISPIKMKLTVETESRFFLISQGHFESEWTCL